MIAHKAISWLGDRTFYHDLCQIREVVETGVTALLQEGAQALPSIASEFIHFTALRGTSGIML
jgi:hypothetical protein